MSNFYSGNGDDGTTSLLGNQRVSKADLRPEAYGAVDEASAALGVARALAMHEESKKVTIKLQKDLYLMMAELAATADVAERFRELDESNLRWLEHELNRFGSRVTLPKEFIIGGDAPASAAYNLARTVVRRAERKVVRLHEQMELANEFILPYLNRLSSMCFVLALWENAQAGHANPMLASESDE